MLLSIRVTLAIIFSALVLWPQTHNTDCAPLLTDTDLIQSNRPAFSLSGRQIAPLQTEPFAFKMNPPEQLSSQPPSFGGKFDSAGQVAADFTIQATSSQPSRARSAAPAFSHSYFVRRKIHKYTSLATMPLIISQAIVGQKLFDERGDESGSLRSAHSALTAGLGAVFGIESVTGVWNMLEARRNHIKSRKHLIHGLLMLAADAGFVATAALAPGHEDEGQADRNDRASAHRAVGYASLGVATVGYFYMLLAK